MKPCKLCGYKPLFHNDYWWCSNEQCRTYGPNNDKDGSKWNALMSESVKQNDYWACSCKDCCYEPEQPERDPWFAGYAAGVESAKKSQIKTMGFRGHTCGECAWLGCTNDSYGLCRRSAFGCACVSDGLPGNLGDLLLSEPACPAFVGKDE